MAPPSAVSRRPGKRSARSWWSPRAAAALDSARITSPAGPGIRTYVSSGSTANPRFEGRVQGVVVQATSDEPTNEGSGASTIRNVANTLGSVTVAYPMATSWSESAVPHRGQYATDLSASNSRPWAWSSLSDHHTLSMYSVSIVQYAWERSIQNPRRSVIRSQSSTYRVTDSRHRRLNSAIPKASMSRFDLVPISFSTSSSTGSPWQSQPAFRATKWPVMVRYRG